jgi:predicted aconitase
MFLKNSQDAEVRVKRTTGIRALGSEFDAFLYAPIAKSGDDMAPSVLSVLARQNIDAWEEAATLASLSRESAIARLASIISTMTPRPPEPAAIAARLIGLLPQSGIFNLSSYSLSPSGTPRNFTPIVLYIVIAVLIIATAVLGN